MLRLKTLNDAIELIDTLDGCGLIITDEDELRERLTESFAPENQDQISGDDAAFTVKFKDLLASGTISDWITRAEMEGVNRQKLDSANRRLTIVNDFQTRNPGLCQLPD